jgi:Protein kinase domain
MCAMYAALVDGAPAPAWEALILPPCSDPGDPFKTHPAIELSDAPELPENRWIPSSTALGNGGIANVSVIYDGVFDRRPRVVKELTPDRASRESALLHEGRVIAALNELGISGVPLFFGYTRGPTGRPALVLERVEGWTLKEAVGGLEGHGCWFSEDVAQPWVSLRRVLTTLRSTALVLHDMHVAGCLHLDVTPGNIMHEESGRAWVIDLGAADSNPPSALNRFTRPSSSGNRCLTPTLSAPEVIIDRSECIGPHSDVFSLGCILHNILFGKLVCFAGFSLTDGWQHRWSEAVRALSVSGLTLPVFPGVPPALHEPLRMLCGHALRYRPEERLPSAATFAAQLGAALDLVSNDGWGRAEYSA